MPQYKIQPVVLEDRKILFRNFSGEEGRFNAKGKRNFNVLLTDEEAEAMLTDGWNIKWMPPRDEGDVPQARIEVSVHFGKNPPQIVLITSKGKTPLDESMINLLDWADIINVDLIIRPYEWEVNGKKGVMAYLKKLDIYSTLRSNSECRSTNYNR